MIVQRNIQNGEAVIPAKAGIQCMVEMDASFRWHDAIVGLYHA
jgi:hypothetical protein